MHNKVVWSEGLFLQPHHLQQQDRYFERYVDGRCRDLTPYGWGFAEVELERDLLSIGKFGLRRAVGVFPDGTPFRVPDDDPLPIPVEIGPQVRDQTVFLALPLRRGDAVAMERAGGADRLARYDVGEREVRNVTSPNGEPAPIEVGSLRTSFLFSSELVDAHACIPVAHVVECRADKRVVLEERFIPTVLHTGAATPLAAFLAEIVGVLHQRGDELAQGIVATSRGGAAEIVDYLELQVVNRLEPLVTHLAASGSVHPEVLFRLCVSAAGELATFVAESNRPPVLPTYNHDRLRQSFEPVMAILRDFLSRVRERRAIPVPVEPRDYGVWLAIVADRPLYSTSTFVLAVRANVSSEELRRQFPGLAKAGPSAKIGDLVRKALPGIPITALPAAPRQIPWHAGAVYFEFNQAHELWAELKTSGNLALHTAEFPGLTMELWAIRG